MILKCDHQRRRAFNYYSIIMRVRMCTEISSDAQSNTGPRPGNRSEYYEEEGRGRGGGREGEQLYVWQINIDNAFSVPFRENESVHGAHKPLLYCYYDGRRRRRAASFLGANAAVQAPDKLM